MKVTPYCWWKTSCTTWNVSNPVNNGLNYLYYLVQDFFHQQSTVSSIASMFTHPVQHGIIFLRNIDSKPRPHFFHHRCPRCLWDADASKYLGQTWDEVERLVAYPRHPAIPSELRCLIDIFGGVQILPSQQVFGRLGPGVSFELY